MIWSSLVKSACVAIALLGLSAPQAGAIELQGSNPSAQLSEGMISKAFIAHRGATAVGPRGGVYHRGGTAVGGYRGGAYRGGVYHGGGVYRGAGVYRGGYGGWARPGWYRWGAGRRDRGRRCDRRFGHRRSRRLRRPAARAGTVLVLYRPELSAGILGRLPVGQGLCGPAEASRLRPSRLGEALSNYRDDRPRDCRLLPKSSLFAKLRGDRSTRFIFVHGFANRREEGLFANLIEQSESLQFVLHRIFEFGEA